MKSKTHGGTEQRRILAAMVTDQTVCSRIAGQWKDSRDGLFDSKWANLVAGWCVKHIRSYSSPPGKQLRPIFDNWAATTKVSESVVGLIEDFLISLSDEYEQDSQPSSSQHILDLAGKYFNHVRAKRIIERAEYELDKGKPEVAHSVLQSVSKVELGEGALIKPAEDFDVWREAWDTETDRPLISYPGKLGPFIDDVMVRDSLVAFMGPDKSGKSMWILDAAYRAIRNRCKVAYFEVGDMSRNQVLKRLGQRAARHPAKAGKIRIPISVSEDGKPGWKEKVFEENLTARKSYKAFKRVCKDQDVFRLSCYPNSSIDVTRISSILQEWDRENWVADVVLIDYADILAPPPMVRDALDQIDMTWRLLRRITQEQHCLLITATQANAKAYTSKNKTLGRQHFSGRKTKLAHVNAMLGINVSDEDKKNGVTKLNFIVRREGYYRESRYVTVAGCLAICSPSMKTAENT